MACEFKSKEDAIEYMKKENISYVDACFVDPLGMWQHTTFHKNCVDEKDLENGFAFDGSSIKLFTTIENSDMVMKPDISTCWVDPFYKEKTLHVTCDVTDCLHNPFARCPRTIAKRTESYLKESGIADAVIFGPEAEFFVFDNVRFSTRFNNAQVFEVDGVDGSWNNDDNRSQNLGHRMPAKNNYFPQMPIDTNANLRTDMLEVMNSIGVPVEKHHHEVASCQHELGFTCRTMLECADMMMSYKYVVKNVAKKHGKTATFMPKPLFGDCGSGMHCHQSLWKNGVNLFWDEKGEYCKLSEMARHYIGGILKHAPGLLAITNPTVNSYKRLVPGYEAPSYLMYSKGNRSAAIRVPLFDSDNPKAKRIEFRCPDPTCNPYLAYSAMVMAGVDGVVNKIEPPPPADYDITSMAKPSGLRETPATLEEALNELEADHDFLLRGGVFTEDYLNSYIAFKRAEAKTISLIPTPKEYELYYHA